MGAGLFLEVSPETASPQPLAPSESQQIRQDSIRARHAVRQLTMKCVREVRVVPLAVIRDQPTARLPRLTDVVRRDNRRVGTVPLRPELRSTLLDPTIEVGTCDPVRHI